MSFNHEIQTECGPVLQKHSIYSKQFARKKSRENTIYEDNDVLPDLPTCDNMICDNCHRVGCNISMFEVKQKSVFNRKFCNISVKELTRLWLCEQCFHIFNSGIRDEYNGSKYVWPAFIWSIFLDGDCYNRNVMWKIIPKEWRVWWLREVSLLHGMENAKNVALYTVDVTEDYAECHTCFSPSGMAEIGYCQFQNMFEKYFTVPRVRCPFGCSEFLPTAKTMKFDVFVQHYIRRKIKCYSCPGKAWKFNGYGFRDDLFDCDCPMLEGGPTTNMIDGIYVEPMFCHPSILLNDGVPYILVCTNHSNMKEQQYIHMPRHPTGVVATSGDNNYAQVVAKPRTIRRFRAKKHTNSYHIARVEGGFGGLDTINLKSQPGYGTEDLFSQSRKFLSLVARPNCLNLNNGNGFQSIEKSDMEFANSIWSCNMLQSVKSKFCKGATYMPLESVVKMHRHIRHSGVSSIIVRKSIQGNDVDVIHSYIRPWVRLIMDVRHCGNKQGHHFPIFSGTKSYKAIQFMVLNMIHMIPIVWEIIDSNVKRNNSWDGWCLFVFSKNLYGIQCCSVGKNHPFWSRKPIATFDEIIMETFRSSEDGNGELSLLRLLSNLFCGCSQQIKVLHYANLDTDTSRWNIYSVVVLLREKADDTNFILSTPEFEVCYVACENVIYSRHPGVVMFWKYTMKGNQIDWCSVDITRNEEDDYIKLNWKICVYVKVSLPAFDKVKEDVLKMHGGQCVVHCQCHHVPLVLLPYQSDGMCCDEECIDNRFVGCPYENCQVGLCKEHLQYYQSKEEKKQVGVCINDLHSDIVPGKNARLQRMDSSTWYREQMSSRSDSVDEKVDDDNVISQETSMNEMVGECDAEGSIYDSDTRSDTSYDYESIVTNGSDCIDSDGDDNVNENEIDLDVFPLGIFDDEWDDLSFEDHSQSSESLDVVCDEVQSDNESNYSDEMMSQDNHEGCHFTIPITMSGKIAPNYRACQSVPNHIMCNLSGACLLRRHRKVEGTKNQQHFLQKLCAVESGSNIPLVYPEGTIFPSYFWTSENDCSIPGALPCCCMVDDKTNHNMGIASIFDHCRTRILDPNLLSSTDSSMQFFSWDMVANLGLRGSMTELVLRRGFEDCIKKEGLKINTDSPACYDGEQVDSRKTVNQLAAACAKKPAHLFFTWTMNGTQTPGVRLITKWCRSDEMLEKVVSRLIKNVPANSFNKNGYPFLDNECKSHITDMIEEAAAVYVLRSWFKFTELFLAYLQYGLDSPFKHVLGGVSHIWDRSEIQSNIDGKGPHHHTIITLKKNVTAENINEVENLIRCGREYFASDTERDYMIKNQFVQSFDDYMCLLDEYDIVCRHTCSNRCSIPKLRRTDGGYLENTGERMCKVPNYSKMNREHCHVMQEVPITYEEDALLTMSELGLIEKRFQAGGDKLAFIPVEQYATMLESKRHLPPCEDQGKISPINPVLFAMLRSSINLQLTTSYSLSRYLAKYVASVDEACRVDFKTVNGKSNQVEISPSHGYNTKITSNKIQKKKGSCKQNNDDNSPQGRAVSVAEMMSHFLGHTQIHTDLKYIHIQTNPMEGRPVIRKKRSPIDILKQINRDIIPDNATIPSDINTSQVFANQAARTSLGFPTCRVFDSYQEVTFVDQLFQRNSVDQVTTFSLRPPELRFVRSIAHYFTWFQRKLISGWNTKDPQEQQHILLTPDETGGNRLCLDVMNCQWIDALGYVVQVRYGAVQKLETYFLKHGHNKMSDFGNHEGYGVMKALLSKLANNTSRTRNSEAWLWRFTCGKKDEDEDDLPVYVYNLPRCTTNPDRFLYHVLLSMGEYCSEFELMSTGSLQNAFVEAGLFSYSCTLLQQEQQIKQLCRQYFQKQLSTYCLSSNSMGRELTCIYRTVRAFLLNGVIACDKIPPALFTQLRDETTKLVQRTLQSKREALITNMISYISPVFGRDNVLPTVEEAMASTRTNPYLFDPEELRFPEWVDKEAIEEHKKGYQEVKKCVRHYLEGSNNRTKSISFVGAGGVGKTVDLRVAGLYAICSGLAVAATTLTGKRSAELAGEHIHIRFNILPNSPYGIAYQAEIAYQKLLKDPEKLALLQRLDLLLLDEMGQIAAMLLAIMDYIMRRIRHTSHWMGGVPVMSTMDIIQLKPSDGIPPIFSSVMFSSFRFVEYNIPLRTIDQDLRELQNITRMMNSELMAAGTYERFCTLMNKCTFVENKESNKIPKTGDVVYCFPRHEKCREFEKFVLEREKQKYTSIVFRTAKDYEETRTQLTPGKASPSTSDFLDRKAHPSSVLYFFPYAIFELTYNDSKKGRFTRYQMCIMLPDDIPTQEQVDRWDPIYLYRSPPGVDSIPDIPSNEDAKTFLESNGWIRTQIGKDPQRKHSLVSNGAVCYREQYGLKHRIAYTVHAIMGCTVTYLVTSIEHFNDIWEASMVVVLLSRTKEICNIIFIGNRQKTINALWQCLTQTGTFTDMMKTTLKSLIGGQKQAVSIPRYEGRQYHSIQSIIPEDCGYSVYMLVSHTDTNVTYVGYTNNLRRRLNQHNGTSKGGSSGTNRPELKPWLYLCFIVGFDSKEDAMQFEGTWKSRIELQSNNCITADHKVFLGKSLWDEYQLDDGIHHFIICGRIY